MIAIKEDVDKENLMRSIKIDEDNLDNISEEKKFFDDKVSTESEDFRKMALRIMETYNARLSKIGPSQF